MGCMGKKILSAYLKAYRNRELRLLRPDTGEGFLQSKTPLPCLYDDKARQTQF